MKQRLIRKYIKFLLDFTLSIYPSCSTMDIRQAGATNPSFDHFGRKSNSRENPWKVFGRRRRLLLRQMLLKGCNHIDSRAPLEELLTRMANAVVTEKKKPRLDEYAFSVDTLSPTSCITL